MILYVFSFLQDFFLNTGYNQLDSSSLLDKQQALDLVHQKAEIGVFGLFFA
jgi:hypothetical protein